MKLLLDENLSPKIPGLIESRFPGSAHVRDCGLKGKPDKAVWEYARANGFTLVSKDGDFYQRSLLIGAPPKFIWLCLGNCTCKELLDLILKHENAIRSFESAAESVLLLH